MRNTLSFGAESAVAQAKPSMFCFLKNMLHHSSQLNISSVDILLLYDQISWIFRWCEIPMRWWIISSQACMSLQKHLSSTLNTTTHKLNRIYRVSRGHEAFRPAHFCKWLQGCEVNSPFHAMFPIPCPSIRTLRSASDAAPTPAGKQRRLELPRLEQL